MSLYVDDPMMFISGVVPEEIQRHITLEEWKEITSALMECEANGQNSTFYAEMCICAIVPLLCPILGCVHLCIESYCIKLERQRICRKINREYFNNKNVMVCGPKSSVYIHYRELLDQNEVAIQYTEIVPLDGKLAEIKATALPIDPTTFPVRSDRSQQPRRSVRFSNEDEIKFV